MAKKLTAFLLSVILIVAIVPAALAAESITKLYPKEETITILVNSFPFMPNTILADYSDGRKGVELPATWAYVEPDNFDAARTVFVEGYTSGTDLAATLKIRAVKPSGVISEILPVDEIVTTVGHAPVMPAYVLVNYSSGETAVQRSITWSYIESDNYDAPRTFYVEGYIDGTDLFTAVAVKVVKPQNEIESILPVDDVKTVVGKAPVLPETVLVKYKNNDKTFPADVIWAYIEADNYDSTRTFYVQGFVDGTDLSVTVKVIVESAAAANKITKVYASQDVKTKIGTAPELPSKVWVRYDGKKRQEAVAVTWDKIEASLYSKAGSFRVSGKVDGTDLKASIKVTVYKPKVVTKTISKIHDLKVVKTTAGIAPKLPTHVYVTYKGDKNKVAVPVTWEPVAASKYASVGKFTVKGTISGTDKKVTVEVRVEKAQKDNSQRNTDNNGRYGERNNNSGNQYGHDK